MKRTLLSMTLLAALLLGAAQAVAQQKGEWFVKPVLGCHSNPPSVSF